MEVGSCQEEELSWEINLVYPGSESRSEERVSQNLGRGSFKEEGTVQGFRFCLMRTDTPSVSDADSPADPEELRSDKAETGLGEGWRRSELKELVRIVFRDIWRLIGLSR